MKPARVTAHLAGAGLFAGGIAWALHQQLQYVLAAMFCGHSRPSPLWSVSVAAVVIVAVGAALSWLAVRSFAAEKEAEAEDAFRARRFVAKVAIMGALLFLFAIMLQAAAIFYLPLCTG
ncbi:MAG TPA: hypothetical protein VHT03_01255 [Rhizomicrobium sp.]|jgi:hypothetical protein|nr:hypothetical protein [Rhizomicrobium sp.]